MKKIIYAILCCTLLFSGGCMREKNYDSTNCNSSYVNNGDENKDEIVTETDNITQNNMYGIGETWFGDTISITKAESILSEKIDNEDSNRCFECDRVNFYDGRCYYIFRCFDNFTDHTVTVGWYAVDVLTGECFDTKVLVDLVPVD